MTHHTMLRPDMMNGNGNMRLYFNLVQGQEVIEDYEGIEVADVGQAQSQALQALLELRRETPDIGEEWRHWKMVIVDDGDVHIGDRVMFAPNVTITTTGHPVEPALRTDGTQ